MKTVITARSLGGSTVSGQRVNCEVDYIPDLCLSPFTASLSAVLCLDVDGWTESQQMQQATKQNFTPSVRGP